MNDIKSCIEESTKKIKEKITPKIAGEIAESCKAKFKKEETFISISKRKRKFTKLPVFGGWSWWFWVVACLVGLSLSISLSGFVSTLLQFFSMWAGSIVVASTYIHFKYPNLQWHRFEVFWVITLSFLLSTLFVVFIYIGGNIILAS